MFSEDKPRSRYEVVPQGQRCFQLLLEFNRSWNFFEQHCPPVWSECARSSDYLSLNTIIISSLIHHLIILHCPLAGLNTACFSFLGSTVLPPTAQLFKEWREVSMSFLSRISQTRSMFFFLFDNPSCSGIKSHILKNMSIKSNCWNEIREMSIFESFFFENQLLRLKIRHTLSNVVLWLSCILKTKIDPL